MGCIKKIVILWDINIVFGSNFLINCVLDIKRSNNKIYQFMCDNYVF